MITILPVLAIFCYFLGWFSREIYLLLKYLKERLDTLNPPKKEKPIEEKKASFAEPMTALQLAAQQERERIRSLNEGIDI